MGFFPYPRLSGTTEQQLKQLKSFLYQLVDKLNYTLIPEENNEKGDQNGTEEE